MSLQSFQQTVLSVKAPKCHVEVVLASDKMQVELEGNFRFHELIYGNLFYQYSVVQAEAM